MKKTVKTICLLLALAMLVPLAVACGGGQEAVTTTTALTNGGTPEGTVSQATTTEPVVTTTAPPVDANGYLLDALPEDLDFKNETVDVLCWSDAPYVEYEGDVAGDIVNAAIYRRNSNVEDRLGVKFSFTAIPGNNSNKESFVTAVQTSSATGAGEFDLVSAYSLTGQYMAIQGLCLNLKDMNYLDLEKPWWPTDLQAAATINNKLYFVSGDISTNMLWYLQLIFYNKTFGASLGVEDPVKLVLDGKWTLDAMEKMTADSYSDLNGDGTKDINDRFGMFIAKTTIDSFLFAAGITVIEHDDKGKPVVSESFGSERTADLVTRLCAYVHDGKDVYTDEDKTISTIMDSFCNNNVLMAHYFAHGAAKYLLDTNVSYTVLPTPKYNEDQKDYITTESFSFSLYMIPLDAKSPDMSGAVVEALGSEGYRTTTPAIFETCLKTKYATDSETAQVYDIIRNGVTFDLGRMFGANLGNLTHVLFRNAVFKNENGWAAKYASSIESLNSKLDDLFKAFE